MAYDFDREKLVQLRVSKFWTQEDLSAASGVSVRTVQRIEREGGGSLESWKALAAAFEVSVDRFHLSPQAPTYTAVERRNAMFGVTIGCLGGLIGCAFGWMGLLQNPKGITHTLMDIPLVFTIVVVATLFCLAVPIATWYQTRA
jgi:DNA-binding XRE family transcriptional regulator